ncbi:MAG: HEPN domain-containing protein [Candidatus Korarchaeota archaeon]|nr:HEPN domain-containing protein [Candidatus Korarchaeota archaeon]
MDIRAKSHELMREAIKDLEVGCYNKAVSAAYFSVRLAAESVLKGLKTRKDDKIANALEKILSRELGVEKARDIKNSYMKLFVARKLADHRPISFSKDEAEAYVRIAGRLREILLKL